MRYRIGILTNEGTEHQDFDTREALDEWLLTIMEKKEVKRYRIKDMETNSIIETEQGRRDKTEGEYNENI
jgi:hypothetical protein